MKNQLILLRFAGHDVEDHAVGGTHGIGAEELMFTQRLKINGKSSTAYRWLYFTANPGDTIEVWGNSTSSSSAPGLLRVMVAVWVPTALGA